MIILQSDKEIWLGVCIWVQFGLILKRWTDIWMSDVLLLSAAEALRMQKTYLKTRFHLCKCLRFGLKWAWVCCDAFKYFFTPLLSVCLFYIFFCLCCFCSECVLKEACHGISAHAYMYIGNSVRVFNPDISLRNYNTLHLSVCVGVS